MFHVLFEDRSRAESFGVVADLYDRVRPSYPPALFDQLLAQDTADVLDVGCGTGIVGVLLAWLAFLETHSDHQTLPPPRRERLLSAVGDAIDELGGSFEISYEAVLVSARRL